MILRLRTSHYRFIYTFMSGHKLVGTVTGDYYVNRPAMVFNLRSLKATGLSPDSYLLMEFDDVFGQFSLTTAETIMSGSHTATGSFFGLNYRNSEACIYDAVADCWVTSGWRPEHWQVQELSRPQATTPRPMLLLPAWNNKAIA